MFLKRIVAIAAATAVAAVGLLAAPSAAHASGATQAEAIACVNTEVNVPDWDLFYASWDAQGGEPQKANVLGRIAAARPALLNIKCVSELQARLVDPVAYIVSLLDSAVVSINKGDWTTADATLSEAYRAYRADMITGFNDLIYG
jgi:hypothetical protein